MKELSVLVKPASSACNIDCKYCFYKDEDKLRRSHEAARMSDAVLETLVMRLFEHTERRVSVVFQGGEPTLMGLPFYEKFMRLVHRYNKNHIRIELSIQTNGILLDESWCAFLRDNQFLVGLSFDGCPPVSDANRVTYQGGGTSTQAVRAIRLLQRFGVEYNVLMVVTRQSAARATECYRYLQGIGVQYLQVIPVLDPYCGEKKEFSLGVEDLGRFLCGLFDVWYEDFIRQREVRVTYFENIIYKLMGKPLTMCSMNGQCCIETVVEADGSVYPCDFYVSDEWKLGDLCKGDLPSLIFSEKAADFIAASVHVKDECSACPYFGLCIGACRRYRHAQSEAVGSYCAGYRSFFRHSLARMQEIAAKIS